MAKRRADRGGAGDVGGDLLDALRSDDEATRRAAARRLGLAREELAEERVAAVLHATSPESSEEFYREVSSCLGSRPERWRMVEPVLIAAALDREAGLDRRALSFKLLGLLRHTLVERSPALLDEASLLVRDGDPALAREALGALAASTAPELVERAIELINEAPRRLVDLPNPRVLEEWSDAQRARIDLDVWRAALATLRAAGAFHAAAWTALCRAGAALLELEPELRELPEWARPGPLLLKIEELRNPGAPRPGPLDPRTLEAFFGR